jgi:hypothetical protein
MALGFYFSPKPPMTAQQYDEVIKRLQKAGAGHPAGRQYHACFGTPESLSVFDVWTSQAAFDKFGQTLMAITQQLGLDPGQPQVMAVHNVIVPPSKSASAGKKGGAAKRSAPKKRAKGGRARRR